MLSSFQGSLTWNLSVLACLLQMSYQPMSFPKPYLAGREEDHVVCRPTSGLRPRRVLPIQAPQTHSPEQERIVPRRTRRPSLYQISHQGNNSPGTSSSIRPNLDSGTASYQSGQLSAGENSSQVSRKKTAEHKSVNKWKHNPTVPHTLIGGLLRTVN